MIEVIVFSHRRQLQLHAYLESLIYFVKPSFIHVITPKETDYLGLPDFPGVIFHSEHHGFDKTLRDTLNSIESRYLMFGCDDVTWIREVKKAAVCQSITPNVLGFSLRLGDHIKPPGFKIPQERKWIWDGADHHWGYPFELLGTVYRTSDVDDLVFSIPNIQHPNHLEAAGYLVWRDSMEKRPYMLRNENASCISQSVNVVQKAETGHSGTEQEDPDILEKKYKEGWRLDWMNAKDAKHYEVWSGSKNFWRLTSAK